MNDPRGKLNSFYSSLRNIVLIVVSFLRMASLTFGICHSGVPSEVSMNSSLDFFNRCLQYSQQNRVIYIIYLIVRPQFVKKLLYYVEKRACYGSGCSLEA